jgi:opacity protein-like surface antigen
MEMRTTRLVRINVGVVAAALGLVAVGSAASAQVAATPPTPESAGWTFSVTPYAWLPTVSSTYSFTGPRGASVTNTISAGIGDYISELNFALMVGGEARYGRFTVMTDLIYSNASVTTGNSHLSSVNLGVAPINIPRELQLSTGTRLATTIWSVAGGYTLLQGDWGNLDGVAGIRALFMGTTSNYTLAADILAPDQTVALSRSGSLSLGVTKVEGIGGVTGRINIPNSNWYLPFYLDAGGGSVPFTWQVYAGVAYKAETWLDVSLGYRYLAFDGGSKTRGVEKLNLGGVVLASSFRF